MTTWHPRFETGHSEIDQEHQQFFVQLEALDRAVRMGEGHAKVVEIIAELQQFVLNHFEREESCMLRLGCPSHPESEEDNREFAQRLEGWLFLLTSTGTAFPLAKIVHREATLWIQSHIENDGCKLRACRSFGLALAAKT